MSIAGDREIARAIRRLYLADKLSVEAISFDEGEDGPVDFVGPLDQGYTQGLDDYFQKAAPPVAVPASPPPVLPYANAPPPALHRPVPAPTAGPEARLADAVRRLKLEDDGSAARNPAAPAPQLIVDVLPEGESEIGLREGCPPEVVRLSRLASAMVCLVLRKGLVTEDELVAEFVRTGAVGPR